MKKKKKKKKKSLSLPQAISQRGVSGGDTKVASQHLHDRLKWAFNVRSCYQRLLVTLILFYPGNISYKDSFDLKG